MPDLKGRLSEREMRFCAHLSAGHSHEQAMKMAGYVGLQLATRGAAKANNPLILAEVDQLRMRHFGTLVPRAWLAIEAALDPKTNPRLRTETARWLISEAKRDLEALTAASGDLAGRDPTEMSHAELASQIDHWRRIQAARVATEADVVEGGEGGDLVEGGEADVFG